MVNKIVPSFLLMAAVVGVVLGVVGLLLSDSVGADGHSGTRSFSPSQIAPRSLAGKPLAEFRATPIRRITVCWA